MSKKFVIADKIKQNEFWSSVIKLSAGQIIGQVITLISTLFLSRIYTTIDYGTLGIITSSAAIIVAIISFALGSAIMVADTDDDSRRIFTVSCLIQGTLLTLVCMGLIVVSPYKRIFNTNIPYSITIALMWGYIGANALFTLMQVYINRLKLNNILFWNALINAGCSVFISIPLGLLGFGFVGLLLSQILAYSLSFFQMLRAAKPFAKINGISDIKKTLIECKKFIIYQYPSNLMGNIANNIPNQTLYNTFGNEALGSYAMCNKMFSMPLNIIATPIQTIYFRTAAKMSERKDILADFTLGFIKKFMLITLVPMISVMVFGEHIFSFFLGKQWAEAGEIAAIMCPYFFFYFCRMCITYLKVSIGRQKTNLVLTIVQLSSALVALALVHLTNDKLIAILVFSVINTAFSIVDIEVGFICLKKNQLKFLLYSLSFLVVSLAVSVALRKLIFS